MYKSKSILFNIVIVTLIYLSSFMIISPIKSITAATNAIELCGKVVVPSLFPFIFCSNLFISLGVARILSRYLTRLIQPIFGVTGGGTLAIILGYVSGYPIGAVCASSLYQNGECDKAEAERLISFCNNSGPMFIIGAVGIGMLKSYNLGILLYLIHILSSLIYAVASRRFIKIKSSRKLPPSRDENDLKNSILDIGAAISQSVDTMLKICGFVIVFAVFASSIPQNPYIYSVIEITGGLKQLLSNHISTQSIALASAFLSFSGISVLAQVASVATPQGLSIKPYILGKSIQAVIAYLLTRIALILIPLSTSAFSPDVSVMFFVPTERQLIYTALINIIYAAIVSVIFVIIAFIADKFDK